MHMQRERSPQRDKYALRGAELQSCCSSQQIKKGCKPTQNRSALDDNEKIVSARKDPAARDDRERAGPDGGVEANDEE